MDILKMLEQLAEGVHYSHDSFQLINNQDPQIKSAFLYNDAEKIKQKFNISSYVANPSDVTSLA